MPEYITIRTARNVEIEYTLAGLGDRVLAKIIDNIIIIGYLFMILMMFSAVSSWPLFVVMAMPAIFYSFIFERFNDGQTPGKNISRIKVASLNGENVSTSMYFIRWLFLLIDLRLVTGVVGMIAILSSEKAQRLGDIVAGTTVISLRPKKSLNDTAFRKINSDYRPQYEVAQRFTDREVETLQQVLRTKAENKNSLIQLAAEKIAQVYSITAKEDARLFLHTLVNDYNYFQYQEHLKIYRPFEQKDDLLN
jgi:uncharacterized RDD family membrane protein YckC